MIAIKVECMNHMPSDCDFCYWFGTRPHPYKGWTDICELTGHCMDDDQPEEWIYSGDGRPKACPLIEVADRKDEPQYSEDDMYWLSLAEDVANGKMSDAGANQAWLEYINHKDEPTISKKEQVDEPKTQTETQNSNLTFEKADERCKGCNHYKFTCDLFSEICRYEPKDEPQTDCAWR